MGGGGYPPICCDGGPCGGAGGALVAQGRPLAAGPLGAGVPLGPGPAQGPAPRARSGPGPGGAGARHRGVRLPRRRCQGPDVGVAPFTASAFGPLRLCLCFFACVSFPVVFLLLPLPSAPPCPCFLLTSPTGVCCRSGAVKRATPAAARCGAGKQCAKRAPHALGLHVGLMRCGGAAALAANGPGATWMRCGWAGGGTSKGAHGGMG
jgi:hypothetical protein